MAIKKQYLILLNGMEAELYNNRDVATKQFFEWIDDNKKMKLPHKYHNIKLLECKILENRTFKVKEDDPLP